MAKAAAILLSKDRVGQPMSKVYKAAGMTCWTLCQAGEMDHPAGGMGVGVGVKALIL